MTKILDGRVGLKSKIGLPDLSGYSLEKIVRRENSPLANSFMRLGSTILNPELEFDTRMLVHLVLDNDIYFDAKEFEKLKNVIIDGAKRDFDFLSRYFDKATKDSYDIINWAKGVKANCNSDEVFSEYITRVLKVMSHLWPVLGPEEWLFQEIETGVSSKIDSKNDFAEYKRVLTLLTAASDLSESNLRKIGMLKGEKLKEIWREYAWIGDQSLLRKYETFDEFMRERNSIKDPKAELEKLQRDIEGLKREREKAITKYKLDGKIARYSEIAQRLPHVRLIRRDCMVAAAYFLKDHFDQLQRNIPLSNFTLGYYWEIEAFFRGEKIDLEKIESRKETYSFLLIDKDFYELDANATAALKKRVETVSKYGNDVRGRTACMGKVRGLARVLLSAKEISRVGLGEILVTSMTTPDYVPAMERAAAFVTDEGGLSCHAAIIAREMKKPCIIGTKIATKVLKDGMMVEVDANRGIVKIVKS